MPGALWLVAAAFFSGSLGTPAAQATPLALNYGGRLVQPDGRPVEGPVDLSGAFLSASALEVSTASNTNDIRLLNSSVSGSKGWLFKPLTNGTNTDLNLFEYRATNSDRVTQYLILMEIRGELPFRPALNFRKSDAAH